MNVVAGFFSASATRALRGGAMPRCSTVIGVTSRRKPSAFNLSHTATPPRSLASLSPTMTRKDWLISCSESDLRHRSRKTGLRNVGTPTTMRDISGSRQFQFFFQAEDGIRDLNTRDLEAIATHTSIATAASVNNN